jgi:hypothetical protein
MELKPKRVQYRTKDIIEIILKLRLEKGFTRQSIVEWLEHEMKLTKDKASRLITEANKKFDEIAIQRFGDDIKEDIERFENLYEKAVKANDTREARELLKEISKLKGHYVERVSLDVKEYNVKFPGIDDAV